MLNYDFRCVHLPYCIQKLPNGAYVVLNRGYKPIGFNTDHYLDYEAYPIGVKFKRLTAKTITKLSHNGSTDAENIYLYDDGCIPTKSTQHMKEYLDRLQILAKLKLETEGSGIARSLMRGEILK